MKKIGLIVACETEAVKEKFPDLEKLEGPKGFELFVHRDDNYELYIIHCGMGTILAAAATQYLIDCFRVEAIFDFGVVGGLADSMSLEKLVIIDRVVHYRYDCSEFMDLKVGQVDGHDSIYLYTDRKFLETALKIAPELKKATIASGDKFVSTPEEKAMIHEKFDCDVCDMESSGILLTCEVNNIPCLLFKAVSDGLSGGAEEFWKELFRVSLVCLELATKVIDEMYR